MPLNNPALPVSSVAVGAALPAGANNIGKVTIDQSIETDLYILGTTAIDQAFEGSNRVAIDQRVPGSSNKVVAELSGRKLKVGVLKTSYATAVNAGQSATVQITPTAGYIGRLVSVGFYVDAVAGSTGSHSLAVQVGVFNGSTTIYSILYVSVVGTSPLIVSPTSQVDYGFKHTPFSAEQPLNLVYTAPQTNPQTAARLLLVIWEEEAVV